MKRKNPKGDGERGQRITIGELAKYDIDVAIPLSDNLAFDLILIFKNKIYKAQVKSSSKSNSSSTGSIAFDLRNSDGYKGEHHLYSGEEVDVFLCCDYDKVYILGKDDFLYRSGFTIRQETPKNKQTKNINLAKDFVLSKERIEKILS